MIEFERRFIQGANCSLSVVELGTPGKPEMVLLHGTHDHALGMVPAVADLLDDYHITGLDLRGHGGSDKPGNYTMLAMVADLCALITQLELSNPVIVAHSLGGHIALRYAAMFPDQVAALAILDGMGPPHVDRGPRELAAMLQAGVKGALRQDQRSRRMADFNEALSRFRKSNPNLDRDSAQLIVEHGVEAHSEGGLRWRFDPNIDLIFHTYTGQDVEQLVALLQCQVLLLTGNKALDFWRGVNPQANYQRSAYEQDQRRRESLFAHARWQEIPDAGHSVHYDQPVAVQQALRTFLLGEGLST
jgi:pimeloyl-ACP methyl ester carboxylesterase